jgi:carbonic anhydrase/acetyltransferase-like protein (isoleucine patch superfamily)
MKQETGNNASIITYGGITPKLHSSVFTCEGVRIIGDVEIGKDSSVWYNSVIRGDVNYIRIGEAVNIQDMSMIHVTNKKYPTILEDKVSLAHSVTIHGCTLKEGCLIGMGALVLDNATVGKYALVAAGAVVRENFVVPDAVLIAGVPGKIIRDLTQEEIERVKSTSDNYKGYIKTYRDNLG